MKGANHATGLPNDFHVWQVWHTHKETSVTKTRHGTIEFKRQRHIVGRWLTIGLGVAVGLAGCFVTFFTELIVHEKLHFVAHILEVHEGETGVFFLLIYISASALCLERNNVPPTILLQRGRSPCHERYSCEDHKHALLCTCM